MQTATHEALQVAHETISREHAALEAEASSLRTRLSELIEVQQQLAEVQVQHDAATARLAQLEEQNEVGTHGGHTLLDLGEERVQ